MSPAATHAALAPIQEGVGDGGLTSFADESTCCAAMQEVKGEEQQREGLPVAPRPSTPAESSLPAPSPAIPPHSLALPPPSPRDAASASPRGLPQNAAQEGKGSGDDDGPSSLHERQPPATASAAAGGAKAGGAKEGREELSTIRLATSSAVAVPEETNTNNEEPGEQQPRQQRQQQQHMRQEPRATKRAAAAGRSARMAWQGSVMEEDVERNGALAGGRRVDYCLQVWLWRLLR